MSDKIIQSATKACCISYSHRQSPLYSLNLEDLLHSVYYVIQDEYTSSCCDSGWTIVMGLTTTQKFRLSICPSSWELPYSISVSTTPLCVLVNKFSEITPVPEVSAMVTT